MNRRPVLAALAAAVMLAPAACSSGGSAPTTASPSVTSLQAELAAGRRFAQCARTHGYPAFPDPVISNDRVSYPSTNDNVDLKQQVQVVARVPACKTLFTQMQSFNHPRPKSTARPNAAVIRQLTQLAECIRQHGVPTFPDPASDGTFPVSRAGLGDPKRNPVITAALDACNQYAKGAAADFGGFS
jgi:hypothetical protein